MTGSAPSPSTIRSRPARSGPNPQATPHGPPWRHWASVPHRSICHGMSLPLLAVIALGLLPIRPLAAGMPGPPPSLRSPHPASRVANTALAATPSAEGPPRAPETPQTLLGRAARAVPTASTPNCAQDGESTWRPRGAHPCGRRAARKQYVVQIYGRATSLGSKKAVNPS